jgi:hypothetical protein
LLIVPNWKVVAHQPHTLAIAIFLDVAVKYPWYSNARFLVMLQHIQ